MKQIPLHNVGGWAVPNELKDLVEQRLTSLDQKEILPADGRQTQTATIPWVSSLPCR